MMVYYHMFRKRMSNRGADSSPNNTFRRSEWMEPHKKAAATGFR